MKMEKYVRQNAHVEREMRYEHIYDIIELLIIFSNFIQFFKLRRLTVRIFKPLALHPHKYANYNVPL